MAAGNRIRTTIYLIVAVLVAVVAVYANTESLTFAAQRMETMRAALREVNLAIKKDNPSQPSAARIEAFNKEVNESQNAVAVAWACRLVMHECESQGKVVFTNTSQFQEARSQFTETLAVLDTKRADLRSVQVPLFGASVDIEDLGLLSGLTLWLLFLFCGANLQNGYQWVQAPTPKPRRLRAKASYGE